MIAQHADIASSLAAELGLPAEVQNAIAASYERWDGRGWPGELRGDSVPLASRLAQLAEYMEVAHRVGGEDAAVAMARKRRGTQFDPDLANLICTDTVEILGGLGTARTWDAVIGAEPALSMTLSGEQLGAALLGVANFVDLKSPYMLGHASAVAKPRRNCRCHARPGRRRGRTAAPGRAGQWPGQAGHPRIRSGISPGRSAPASENGYACSRT